MHHAIFGQRRTIAAGGHKNIAKFPQARRFELRRERLLQKIREIRARHHFIRCQREAKNLAGRHCAHRGVMFRDHFGFRHARVVDYDDLVAARARQHRCEQKKYRAENGLGKFHLFAGHFQSIPRERHARRQFGLRFVMVVIVREMRKISFARADAPCRRQRLVEAHVRRMRLVAQRVEHGDFHAANFFHRRVGNFLAVAQIREPLFSVLLEQKSGHRHAPVRQVASFSDTGRHTIGGTYTGTTLGVDSIVWKFGDGTEATGTSVLHTFAAVGTYHVCVIAYSHCGNDTACNYDTVICVSAPVAAFTDTGRITIGTTYTGTTTAVDSVVWNFGDGTTSTGISSLHTYTATGIYHICVTAYSPCGSNTACKYDTVFCIAPPTASFTDTGTHHTVGFKYTGSTAGLDSVVWSFGDGHSGTGISPFHTYTASGTYFVCATIFTPCGIDSACDSVTVTVPTIVSAIQTYGNVKIYPNPVTNELNITCITETTHYQLMNVTGENILDGELELGNNVISMIKIIPGIYILEMISEEVERNFIRIIKE